MPSLCTAFFLESPIKLSKVSFEILALLKSQRQKSLNTSTTLASWSLIFQMQIWAFACAECALYCIEAQKKHIVPQSFLQTCHACKNQPCRVNNHRYKCGIQCSFRKLQNMQTKYLVKGELSGLQLWQETVVVFNRKPRSLPVIFHFVNNEHINHAPQQVTGGKQCDVMLC